jgi:hypothetical protein
MGVYIPLRSSRTGLPIMIIIVVYRNDRYGLHGSAHKVSCNGVMHGFERTPHDSSSSRCGLRISRVWAKSWADVQVKSELEWRVEGVNIALALSRTGLACDDRLSSSFIGRWAWPGCMTARTDSYWEVSCILKQHHSTLAHFRAEPYFLVFGKSSGSRKEEPS